jgi:hypothetical protein
MTDFSDDSYETDEQDIKILVDTLRQCFLAERARYYTSGHQNTLFIEIEGLGELSQEEISEVAEPVLAELDLDFDEIALVPLGDNN